MQEIYNKIANNKALKIIITSFLFIAILCYFTFIQYESIVYNNRVSSVKKEIKELITKVNKLKDKETLLESNINTSNSELEALKATLSTLQNDLKAANDKLNSL